MIRINSDTSAGVRPLGSATVENRSTLRRRVMLVTCLPLTEVDGYRMGEPVTVIDSGTGQPERCQVESWALPYPSGAERVIRLTYPAILPANSLRIQHAFEVSRASAAPTFVLRPNALQALQNAALQFFCGPKATHYCTVFAPGTPPQVVVDGTRSKLFRFFARLYEPAQAPTLRTQLWAEFDVELLSDEDYAYFWARWGVCDPRVNDDIHSRAGLSDEETETGFWMSTGDQAAARLVPFYQMQTVRSLSYQGGRWQWVWDARSRNTAGTVLNELLPWGCMLSGRGVILFGSSAGLGDQLRNDSLDAWVQRPIPTQSIGNDWRAKEEAYGPAGIIPMRPKAHHHWSGWDWTRIRGSLETECEGVLQRVNTPAYAWDNYWGTLPLGMASNHVDGGASSEWDAWTQNPHWTAISYAVPGMGSFIERLLHTQPYPTFYRELDGRIVRAVDHPNMVAIRGAVGELSSSQIGDMLGKSLTHPTNPPGLQRWRAIPRQAGLLLHRNGSVMEGADEAHWDNPWFSAHSMIFGDRGVQRICEHHGLTWLMADWQPHPVFRGRTGQARGFARGTSNHAWYALALGGAPGIGQLFADRVADSVLAHYMLPARQLVRTQWPGALYRGHDIYSAVTSGRRADFVELWDEDYCRTWEVCHGMTGYAGLPRLLAHLRPEIQEFRSVLQYTLEDMLTLGIPRIVDPVDGRIIWQWQPPDTARGIASFALAFALSPPGNEPRGGRKLTAGEWAENNHQLCLAQNPFNCSVANFGFARFHQTGGGSPAGYMRQVVHWALGGRGEIQDAIVLRHILDGQVTTSEDHLSINFDRDNTSLITATWRRSKMGMGRMDPCAVGAAVARGAHGQSGINGMSVSRLHADNAYLVTTGGGAVVRRHNRITGATVTTFTPDTAPVHPWTGVCCVGRNGVDFIVYLDGLNPTFDRSFFRVAVATEAAPSATQSWTFTCSDNVSRELRGIVWDRHASKWLIGAWLASEGSSLWWLDDGVNVAFRVPISQIVFDQPQQQIATLAADADGLLLVVCYVNGRRDVYRWTGAAADMPGIWGVPRVRTTGDSIVALTHHARDDDAQRLVTAANGGTFGEHPI